MFLCVFLQWNAIIHPNRCDTAGGSLLFLESVSSPTSLVTISILVPIIESPDTNSSSRINNTFIQIKILHWWFVNLLLCGILVFECVFRWCISVFVVLAWFVKLRAVDLIILKIIHGQLLSAVQDHAWFVSLDDLEAVVWHRERTVLPWLSGQPFWSTGVDLNSCVVNTILGTRLSHLLCYWCWAKHFLLHVWAHDPLLHSQIVTLMWSWDGFLRSVELRELIVLHRITICRELPKYWAWFRFLHFLHLRRAIIFSAGIDKRIHILLDLILHQVSFVLLSLGPLLSLGLLPAVTVLILRVLFYLGHTAEILLDVQRWIEILWYLFGLTYRQLFSIRKFEFFYLRVCVHDFRKFIFIQDWNAFRQKAIMRDISGFELSVMLK